MRREYDFSQGTRGKHAKGGFRIAGDTGVQKPKPIARRTTTRGRAQDVTARILSAKRVTVSWVYENTEGFLYENVPGTIVSNASTKSIRFELREKSGDDANFEAVIRNTNGSYTLSTDHPEIAQQEFSLKAYLGSDGLVLYLEDATNRAYFHIS